LAKEEEEEEEEEEMKKLDSKRNCMHFC